MFRLSIPILAFGVFLAIAAGTEVRADGALNPDAVKLPDMTPALNLGKMNYDALCASCHGKNTAGTDKGPTFLHKFYHPGHHGDAAFYAASTKGVKAHHWPFGDMLPVEGIKKAQMEKIVFYVRAVQQANGLF